MGVQKLCELSLLDSDIAQFAPHTIAFACWSLARIQFGYDPWPSTLAIETRCDIIDIDYAAQAVVALKQELELTASSSYLLQKIVFVPNVQRAKEKRAKKEHHLVSGFFSSTPPQTDRQTGATNPKG